MKKNKKKKRKKKKQRKKKTKTKKKQKKKLKKKQKKTKKKELESRESLRKGRNYVFCFLSFIDFGCTITSKSVQMHLQMGLGDFVEPSASL